MESEELGAYQIRALLKLKIQNPCTTLISNL
jgi:hypothetical protein